MHTQDLPALYVDAMGTVMPFETEAERDAWAKSESVLWGLKAEQKPDGNWTLSQGANE